MGSSKSTKSSKSSKAFGKSGKSGKARGARLFGNTAEKKWTYKNIVPPGPSSTEVSYLKEDSKYSSIEFSDEEENKISSGSNRLRFWCSIAAAALAACIL